MPSFMARSRSQRGSAASLVVLESLSAAWRADKRRRRWVLSHSVLSHRPRFATVEQGVEIARATLGAGGFDLVIQLDVVLRRIDIAKHADRLGKFRMPHAAEQVGMRRLRRLFVMEQQVVGVDALAQLYDLRLGAVEANALVLVLAKDERL